MKGISYISTPRPGAKRGGGAGIVLNLNEKTLHAFHLFRSCYLAKGNLRKRKFLKSIPAPPLSVPCGGTRTHMFTTA
jgi:hypothetical protein